jgi:ribosomal protein S18 acetylase RimI-like enzyme
MRIRVAEKADFPAVMDLYLRASDAMVGTPFDCCWRRGGHPSEELVASLIDGGMTLVALEGEQVIGAVGVNHDLGHDYGALPWLVDATDEQVAAIHLLVIDEAWRGQGLSRKLLLTCLDESRARGLVTARLDATANNKPAIRLYQSEGFEIVGEDSVDVGFDEPIPFVVMERVL